MIPKVVGLALILAQFTILILFTDGGIGVSLGWFGGVVFTVGYLLLGDI